MHDDHYRLDAKLAETHWWWVARRKLLHRLLSRFVGKGTDRKILEVGCSTGSNLRMLQGFGTVHGMELHGPAVEYSRARLPDIRIYHGGIPDPLRDAYDIICLFDVLEHIDDEESALEWIDDHLVPGGMLFVTVPAFDFLWSHHDELAQHCRRYRRPMLEALLRRRFQIAYASYFNTHLFPGIAAVRLVQRSFGLDGGGDKAAGGRGFANSVLQAIFAAEWLWLPAFTLPFGVSIFAVARKPKS